MTIYYSASNNAFFSSDIHADLPADVVEITQARHHALLSGHAEGAQITAGADGHPRLRRPSLSDRRASLLRAVKREAARRIQIIAPLWRQLNDMRAPDSIGAAARFAAIDAVRVASGLIETQLADASADDLAAIDIATHAAWPEATS